LHPFHAHQEIRSLIIDGSATSSTPNVGCFARARFGAPCRCTGGQVEQFTHKSAGVAVEPALISGLGP
jgi:hypothetical protein